MVEHKVSRKMSEGKKAKTNKQTQEREAKENEQEKK